tara:strand:+ start:708 stop:968 length:261 start_codon:yes stop_codon:yes gene_type:complete
MNFSNICVTSIILASTIVFLHYLDNVKNKRREISKYYYKRTCVLGLFIVCILFIINTHLNSNEKLKSHNIVGSGGMYSIQTGAAPF